MAMDVEGMALDSSILAKIDDLEGGTCECSSGHQRMHHHTHVRFQLMGLITIVVVPINHPNCTPKYMGTSRISVPAAPLSLTTIVSEKRRFVSLI